jgi:hypothetical protein
MSRFFAEYFPDAAPQEISEAEARASGTYSEEVTRTDTPRHLRVYLEGELLRITYLDGQPSAALLASQRERYPGAPSWIVSPVVHEGETAKYSIWYVDEQATLGNRVDYENQPRLGWSRWYHPDGSYGGAMERRYDENGDSLEVREHSPDGRVIIVDD